MKRLPEPDDLDIVVDGRNSDPNSLKETLEFIEAYKNRPEYAEEAREARASLEELRKNSKDYQALDPAELLAHWHRTVAELKRRDQNGSPESEVGSQSAEIH